jgi:hypothetical protein
MSDPFVSAGNLVLANSNAELALQIEALRNQLPKPPTMEYSRAQFEALDAEARMQAIKRRAKLYDGPPPTKPKLPDGAILRSDFDKLAPPERHRLIRAGTAIHD